jgi:hypothetical protein
MLAEARRALTPEGEEPRSGGLVHLSGTLSSSGLRDALFGEVHLPDALRLRRTTEVFEWHEHKHVHERLRGELKERRRRIRWKAEPEKVKALYVTPPINERTIKESGCLILQP